jgi:ectoine hydroxylase-related dioxygenase (phytanoyl-CoA dioxygenase family)
MSTAVGLAPTRVRFFEVFGYLPIGQVSTPEEITELKREFARLTGTSGTDEPAAPQDHLMYGAGGYVRVGLHLCHLSEPFRAHALNPVVLGLMAQLFGEPAVVLTSLLFNKPPLVGEPLSWHQDLPYYPYLHDNQLITCWTALDAVDRGNGPVRYVPGSHRRRYPHRQTGGQQALDIAPALVDEARAVTVRLAPGEAVMHHGLTVHASGPNTSSRPRQGLATLYIPASATVTPDQFAYPVLPGRPVERS